MTTLFFVASIIISFIENINEKDYVAEFLNGARDLLGVPRETVVSAYQYGMGMMEFITPTGLILATLVMVDVTVGKWFKFVMPLLGIIFIFSSVALIVGVYL